MRKYLTLALLFSSLSTAQTPVPKVSDHCPTGTYSSGDYCKPSKSTVEKGDVIINKSGDRCPTGFYSSGSYCKAYGGSDKEVITRESGAKCPVGWYKSGGYCVNYKK